MTNFEKYRAEIDEAVRKGEPARLLDVAGVYSRVVLNGCTAQTLRDLMAWAAAEYAPKITQETVEAAVEIGLYCESRGEECEGCIFKSQDEECGFRWLPGEWELDFLKRAPIPEE